MKYFYQKENDHYSEHIIVSDDGIFDGYYVKMNDGMWERRYNKSDPTLKIGTYQGSGRRYPIPPTAKEITKKEVDSMVFLDLLSSNRTKNI